MSWVDAQRLALFVASGNFHRVTYYPLTMAKDQRNLTRLLENVQDQELPASAAIWLDAPSAPAKDLAQSPDPLMPRSESPPANLKRSNLIYRHLVMSIVTSAAMGLLVLWFCQRFYQQEIAPRLAAQTTVTTKSAEPQAAAVELAKAEEKIAALQQQLDVIRREQLSAQQSTRESLERISGVLKNPQLAPQPAIPAAGQPGTARIADAAPQISPTQAEFILLKERNRLIQYGDEAIATGMRKPLSAIVEYLRDPGTQHLQEAAQVEYMRVVRSIQFMQRDDPGYRLPLAELFKGQNLREEADVKPDALLKLLADHQQPWEVRVRVCFLLLGSNAPETNAKLIAAIKDDPSLEVAKHAQLALEQRIQRRFRIFDIPAIDEWWQAQGQ